MMRSMALGTTWGFFLQWLGVAMPISPEETFNFAQMLQGENVPASVEQLQEKIRQHGHWAERLRNPHGMGKNIGKIGEILYEWRRF